MIENDQLGKLSTFHGNPRPKGTVGNNGLVRCTPGNGARRGVHLSKDRGLYVIGRCTYTEDIFMSLFDKQWAHKTRCRAMI